LDESQEFITALFGAYCLSAVFRYSIIFTGGFALLPYQGQ